MDIGKAFGFVFQDEKWISKILIGGLVTLIPFVNFAAIGYMLKVAQNVAAGNPNPLPEWSDFGDHFMRGLYGVVIGIVYSIPLIIVYCVYYVVLIGAAAATSADNSDAASAAAGAIGIMGCIFGLLIFVLAFVSVLFSYAGMARYVATNSLSEALKIGEVIGIVRRQPGPWFMLLLVSILGGIVASLGFIGCFVGIFFTTFYIYCVQGHALGQTVASLGLSSTSDYPTTPTYQ